MEDTEYPRVLSPLTKGPITHFVLEGKQVKSPAPWSTRESTIRNLYASSRSQGLEDTGEFSINPDPVPYQPQNFMSSTLLKKVPIPRRHMDTFGGYGYEVGAKKGVILHTDRYQWEGYRSLDFMNQRERLQAEFEYMEKLRGIKRRREVMPHRSNLDLLMGGKKMEFCERFEIQREIQKLKSLILPQNARDLYHGRGFRLPEDHNSMKPRRAPALDLDLDDQMSHLQNKLSFDPETGRAQPRFHRQGESDSSLPKINNRGYLLGHGSPIILSKEKRTIDNIKARLRIPSSATQTPQLSRSKTNASSQMKLGKRSHTTFPANNGTVDGRINEPSTIWSNTQLPKKIEIPTELILTAPPISATSPPTQKFAVPQTQQEAESDDTIEAAIGDNPSREHSEKAPSPDTVPTPNPLKGSELRTALSEKEQTQLEETFKKLDTDNDGHLKYNQVQTQLPKSLSPNQEKFMKQVYELVSSSTFFGIEEFLTMNYLTKTITETSGPVKEAYEIINFTTLAESISQYVSLFQSMDVNQRGKISLDELKQILSIALPDDLTADASTWQRILESINLGSSDQVTKIEYLASVPYFMSLETK
ncbi:hypothetical protein CHS0354_011483 [Potamilus streckersoni]|uniref:EF-hand domain-containing protein n=1 Tax=Potamilus streckersoni TaxID=2493646 RepID=A0AAE0VX66_9BIVA|nr:hypothetical protein CHS0354_011483 [Potamilus streckersoni]